MNDGYFSWRKMRNKDKDIFPAEDMLRDLEKDYPCAAARFLSREPSKDPVWILKGKKGELSALIINSKSTVLPVFCAENFVAKNGKKDMPNPKFLGGFFQLKRIHSVQGIKEEVIFMEDAVKQFGREISDIFDYDLMSLDQINAQRTDSGSISGLILRAPRMTDLDALAPLQAAYEHEEVLHKGSVFSPAASRVNLAKIISGGKILAAEVNGRLVGKINVSGTSFTKYVVGGVYIHPDFRSQGIAGKMAYQFIASLTGDGMGVSLYVKKGNTAARKLYDRLGFKVVNDYRITYFYD